MKKMIVLLSMMAFSVSGIWAQEVNDKIAKEVSDQIAKKVVAAMVPSLSLGGAGLAVAQVELIQSLAERTAAATPDFLKEEYEAGVKQEAAKAFTAYFVANPKAEVQEEAYKPLAELLTAAIGLNRMIARTPNVDDRENFAIQWFFSQDIPGKYAALKAINPELAAATNELMNSFMDTVSNGTFYGGPDHPDMQAMRAFKQAIVYRY